MTADLPALVAAADAYLAASKSVNDPETALADSDPAWKAFDEAADNFADHLGYPLPAWAEEIAQTIMRFAPVVTRPATPNDWPAE